METTQTQAQVFSDKINTRIQKRLNEYMTRLETLAKNKGFFRLSVTFSQSYEGRCGFSVSAYTHPSSYDHHYYAGSSGNGDTIEEAFEECVKDILDKKSVQEINEERFHEQLARVIDLGKTTGVDLDILNPIVEQAKKLATNALTYGSKYHAQAARRGTFEAKPEYEKEWIMSKKKPN